MPVSGVGEARQLTSLEGGVENLSVPEGRDGSMLLFSAEVFVDEQGLASENPISDTAARDKAHEETGCQAEALPLPSL